jgi:hypothetical protein
MDQAERLKKLADANSSTIKQDPNIDASQEAPEQDGPTELPQEIFEQDLSELPSKVVSPKNSMPLNRLRSNLTVNFEEPFEDEELKIGYI